MRGPFQRLQLSAGTIKRLDFYAPGILGAKGEIFFFQSFLSEIFFKKKFFCFK